MAIHQLTPNEAATYRKVPFGRKHPVRQALEALKPGQILRIGREDYKSGRRTPNFFCRQISKATGAHFKVENEVGRTGWIVTRVE